MTARTRKRRTAAFLGPLWILWCDFTHGGGWVMRDPLGRINWQCCKCGRWSTPVPPENERKATDYAIQERRRTAAME